METHVVPRNKTDGYVEPSTPGYSWNDRSWSWWTVPSDRPESMRCGRDNMAWANKTDVLTVYVKKQNTSLDIASHRLLIII